MKGSVGVNCQGQGGTGNFLFGMVNLNLVFQEYLVFGKVYLEFVYSIL